MTQEAEPPLNNNLPRNVQQLPQWRLRQSLYAVKIARLDLVAGQGNRRLLVPEDLNMPSFEVDSVWALRHGAKPGQYYYIANDGYPAVMGSSLFEALYAPL